MQEQILSELKYIFYPHAANERAAWEIFAYKCAAAGENGVRGNMAVLALLHNEVGSDIVAELIDAANFAIPSKRIDSAAIPSP